MDKNVPKPAVEQPASKKEKRPSKGQRIHRRRTLALQRRTQKAEAVTTRESS